MLMENPFVSFRDALEAKKAEIPQPKFRSERAELLNELYTYYEKSYKQNTWVLYREWLKKNKFKHSTEKVAEYKKDKSYVKIIPIKRFCSYWFNFLKTEDLYYLISIAKDKEKRGENFNRWVFWAIKKQTVV